MDYQVQGEGPDGRVFKESAKQQLSSGFRLMCF